MIAAYEHQDALHIVKWTGRVRLHAEARTYCGQTGDAAEGVVQVPETVFTQGLSFAMDASRKLKPCPRCRLAMQASVG